MERLYKTSVRESPMAELRGGRGISRLLVSPESAGVSNVDVHINELDPRSGPGPMHYHERAENVYWVLDGWLQVDVDGSTVLLTQDQLLVIAPGVPHATSNAGAEVARFIEIYAPAGPDFHIVDPVDAV